MHVQSVCPSCRSQPVALHGTKFRNENLEIWIIHQLQAGERGIMVGAWKALI